MLSNNVKRLFIRQIRCNIRSASVRALSTAEDINNPTSKPATNFKGDYDVIIAGGGMVGCTLACALAKDSLLSNLKILLLEGSPNKKFQLKPEYSNRVVALNQNTKSLMNSLNIWRHVENMRLQPVRNMQVWDACSDAMITFSSAEMLDDDVAYIVENDVMLHAINTELNENQNKNVSIVYDARIAGYELPKPEQSKFSPKSRVVMANEDTYTCQLLIGADGANSAVRKAMGVQYLSWSYEQMGVVATLELAEECVNNTAWQRWLPSGPIAILPLDSKRSSLVWSTWQDNAKQLLKLPEDQFVDALNDALDDEIDWMCGGALVTDRHVVTAAHCVQKSDYGYVLTTIRLGEHDTRTDPDCELKVCAPAVQDRAIKNITSHPSFNKPAFHNDVAIIELDKPVTLNDYVMPICLPRTTEQLANFGIGDQMTVAGWGKMNMTTEERAKVLQVVGIPIVAPAMCDSFGKGFKLSESEICAGAEHNKDACGGDSGGPLMKVFDTPDGPKNYLVGVVSFGPTICGIKKPGVYASVSHFLKWILDNLV